MKAARLWWSRPGTHCHLVCAGCCTAHTNQSTSAETSDVSVPIDPGWGAVLEAVAVFQSVRCLCFGFRWIPIRAALRNGWSSGQYLPTLQEWEWWNARCMFLILLINNLEGEPSKIMWGLLESTDAFAVSVNLTPWGIQQNQVFEFSLKSSACKLRANIKGGKQWRCVGFGNSVLAGHSIMCCCFSRGFLTYHGLPHQLKDSLRY